MWCSKSTNTSVVAEVSRVLLLWLKWYAIVAFMLHEGESSVRMLTSRATLQLSLLSSKNKLLLPFSSCKTKESAHSQLSLNKRMTDHLAFLGQSLPIHTVLDVGELRVVRFRCEDPELTCIELDEVALNPLDSIHVSTPAVGNNPEAGHHHGGGGGGGGGGGSNVKLPQDITHYIVAADEGLVLLGLLLVKNLRVIKLRVIAFLTWRLGLRGGLKSCM